MKPDLPTRKPPVPESIREFLERHEEAGSPNELTITGLAEIKVTLGELRALVRALKHAAP